MGIHKNLGYLVLAIIIPALFSGCAGVQYESMSKNGAIQFDPASPPRGAFSFNLKSSDILITQGTDASNPPKNPIPCTTTANTTCSISNITVTPSPTLDNDIYAVLPLSSHPSLAGTLITPKYDTSNTIDPTSLTSVSFNYNNQVPTILSAVGTGATAGFAFGTPGAIIAGVAAGAAAGEGIFHAEIKGTNTTNPSSPASSICSDSQSSYNDVSSKNSKPTGIKLPVSVPYESFKPDESTCWHKLPYDTNAGWFYKIDLAASQKNTKIDKFKHGIPPILSQAGIQTLLSNGFSYKPLEFPFMKTSDFFDSEKNVDAKDEFPVSACVSVNVTISWWTDLETKKNQSFTINVADPNFVQVIKWHDGSTVTVSQCGGYANIGTPSQPISDDINGLIKQVSDIKAAQQSHEKTANN